MRITILSFLCLLLLVQNSMAQNVNQLKLNFKNPPLQARPKALWPWVNGNFSFSQITYEMEEAKRKGMAGFDIWDCGIQVNANNVVPAGPAFLSEESLNAINHAINEGDRLGMEMGLISSSSWNAGGSWIKAEHSSMGLYKTDTVVNGPIQLNATLPFPTITGIYNAHGKTLLEKKENGLPLFYKEVAVLAFPFTQDSIVNENIMVSPTFNVNENGVMQVTCSLPAGKWKLVRYVCAPTGQPLKIPSPNSFGYMLDHFSLEAQQFNLNYIFSKLKNKLGELKNRSLKYIYEDSYEVNAGVWTPALAATFQARTGYSIFKYLPVLDGFVVNSKEVSERFLFDFSKTLSELIIKNHYAAGTSIAAKHGLGFYAEAGGPGKPIHNVPFEDLKALGALTIPRGEFWNKVENLEALQIIKGIASSAHIYNQRIAEAEAFTSVWLWQEGPAELKPLVDRALCEGLNRFVYHTFPHTPPESGNPGWIYNFGTIINTTNGWWSKSADFHNYIARSSYLLQQGEFVGDVAFYYGDEAPNFVKPKHIPDGLGFGYDYDVINTDVILNKLTVKNGRLYLPHGQYYEVLVLPADTRINPDVLIKLEQFAAAGATIIGPKPIRTYGLVNYQQIDAAIQHKASVLWKGYENPDTKENRIGKGKIVWGRSVKEELLSRGVQADFYFTIPHPEQQIDYIHRKLDNSDIYFIRNKTNTAITGNARFRVNNKIPEWWDAETGTTLELKVYKFSKDGVEIPFSLPGNGSAFIVFKKSATSKTTSKPYSIIKPFVYSSKGLLQIDTTQSIQLSKQWKIKFEKYGNVPTIITMPVLQSLHLHLDSTVSHFSGKAVYENSFSLEPFSLDKKIVLQLNEVKEVAEIFINGNRTNIHWHDNMTFDITSFCKPGINSIVIEVLNTPNNKLVSDSKKPQQERIMNTSVNKLANAWSKNMSEAPLIKSGLIGPVIISRASVIN